MALTYEPIATTTLGSAASSITFSSISSAYTDLRLVFVPIADGGRDVLITYNSDTGTNYSKTDIYGSGTTAGSQRATSASSWRINATTATSPLISFYTIDLFSYSGSTYKTALATANEDRNGNGYVLYSCGLWRSTSAINTIDIKPNGAFQWQSGTTATLYGILKA